MYYFLDSVSGLSIMKCDDNGSNPTLVSFKPIEDFETIKQFQIDVEENNLSQIY